MPTGEASLLGAASNAAPRSAFAAGPSVATTMALAVRVLPSCSVTFGWEKTRLSLFVVVSGASPGETEATGVLRRRAVVGIFEESCVETAPMPCAGRQFCPVASILITKANKREVVPRSLSKKIPPRKGRKNRSIMASENLSSRSFSRMVVSGAAKMSSTLPSRLFSRKIPTLILSAGVPMGFGMEERPSKKWRRGSATR